MKIFVLLFATLYFNLECHTSDEQQTGKVICYWNSKSNNRIGLPGRFHASDIDASICTHIVYHHIRYISSVMYGWDNGAEFLDIKKRNADVKLLVGIGGPEWGSETPSNLVADASNRAKLANLLNEFISVNHTDLDGCDIDWQWPGQGSGKSDDKINFPLFLSKLKETLPRSKILSISVAPRNEDIKLSYDIPSIEPHVDFINLNTFNLRGTISDTETAFHSPYRKDPNDTRLESFWNAVSIIDSWVEKVVHPEKLTLGIPTYGRSFTLLDSTNHGVGAEVSGIGKSSRFLNETRPERVNYIPYAEICSNFNDENSNWEFFWSSEHFAPYAVFDGDQWVGYDDENSTLAKIHLVRDKNLGGINYAYVDFDDFSGACGTPFQLIRLGYDVLINGDTAPNPVDPTTTTASPGDTSPLTTTEETTETASEDSTIVQDTTTIPDESSSDPTTTTQKTTTTKRESTTRMSTSAVPTPPITLLTTTSRNDYSSVSTETTEQETTPQKDSTLSTIPPTSTDFRTPAITPQEKENYKKELFVSSLSPKIIDCISANGNQKYPNDCTKFIICASNVPYVFNCEDGFYYDEMNNRCDHQFNVLCHF